jgi:DNA-binding NtrC family response regulator
MKPRILIVDDQVSFCQHIRTILEQEEYKADVAHGADEALDRITSQTYDILLTDMKLPGVDGLGLFKLARNLDPEISGIIMTAYGSISSAVDSIKQGVTDYLQKPFEPDFLLMAIEKTVRERKMIQEIRDLRKEIDHRYAFGNIVGKSRKMQRIYDLIEKVAPTDARVFITGETGVGKELVAKAIHFNSRRRQKPFVAINCGALADTLLESELFGHERGAFTGAIRTKKGKFEYAHGGTVFLDEIGDISPGMQVKLLRVLQEGHIERVGANESIPVDVRVIAATNQDISRKISSREFRVELFYRLNVVTLQIPPLREHVEDIPLLVKHFLHAFNGNRNRKARNISSRAMGQLMEYHWPGNVRELENVLERVCVTTEGDLVESITFSPGLPDAQPPKLLDGVDVDAPFSIARSVIVRQFERAYLSEALKRYSGNVSETAKRTGINTRTLWRKIKKYGMDRTEPAE